MNIERMQLKGMLAEVKKQYRLNDTESSGLIILLRTLLNPYVVVTDIDTEKVKVTAERLNQVITEMKEQKKQIKKMENDLE